MWYGLCIFFFFFSSRRRHTRLQGDWSSDVCSSDLLLARPEVQRLIPRGIELKWGTEVASRAARTYRALYAVEDRPIITGERSEERRVGKECRSRWSPYH